jgi:hypothetical protein
MSAGAAAKLRLAPWSQIFKERGQLRMPKAWRGAVPRPRDYVAALSGGSRRLPEAAPGWAETQRLGEFSRSDNANSERHE